MCVCIYNINNEIKYVKKRSAYYNLLKYIINIKIIAIYDKC